MWGTFVLALVGIAALWWPALLSVLPRWLLAAVVGLPLVYFAVGVWGATPQPDAMAKFWPLVFTAGGICALWFHWPHLPRDYGPVIQLAQAIEIAITAAAVVRLILALRRAPSNELPDPAKTTQPMSGPASPQAAHAAINRKRG
jgi:hypothetical protein